MKYLILFFTILAIASCKTDFASAEIEASYKSVMKVHDEVMPEIETIQQLQKELNPFKDKYANIMELKGMLESADDGMMEWMRGFKLDKSKTEEEQLKYLEIEQRKINKVSSDMKRSISTAKAFLKQAKSAG